MFSATALAPLYQFAPRLGSAYECEPVARPAIWQPARLFAAGNRAKALVAETDLTLSGSPDRRLTAGAGSGADWTHGTWTVGRGLYAGVHTDRAFGFIDEVRISQGALKPDAFLFAELRLTIVNNGDGTITLSWPLWASDYSLETSATLGSAASWTPVLDSPVEDGAYRRLTLPVNQVSRYYRLSQ